jgi:hypothetical protein
MTQAEQLASMIIICEVIIMTFSLWMKIVLDKRACLKIPDTQDCFQESITYRKLYKIARSHILMSVKFN